MNLDQMSQLTKDRQENITRHFSPFVYILVIYIKKYIVFGSKTRVKVKKTEYPKIKNGKNRLWEK